MKCQATKSHWISRGRDKGAAALIIYVNEDEECFCHQVKFRGNLSKEHDELEELGYTVIEEIFL